MKWYEVPGWDGDAQEPPQGEEAMTPAFQEIRKLAWQFPQLPIAMVVAVWVARKRNEASA